VGAWVAVRGTFDWPAIVLGLAVLLWVAGFDTLYACQDADHDRAAGLRSLPARWGVRAALAAARAFHAGAVVLLAALYALAPLHPVYLAGVAVVAGLLAYEHSLVRHDDLSRVNAAFFTVNGWISIGYFAFTLAALLLA
jgi:4-hydroxybenzoate polyprenyltransferase